MTFQELLKAPAPNQRVLTTLKAGGVGGPTTQAVEGQQAAKLQIHPDLLNFFWGEVPELLPADAIQRVAAVVYGQAALVHPESGVIFALARGRDTLVMRLPEEERLWAQRAPFEIGKMCKISPPDKPATAPELGADWAYLLPFIDDRIPMWAVRAYAYAG